MADKVFVDTNVLLYSSEDLQENQKLEDLRIVNPFRTGPAAL